MKKEHVKKLNEYIIFFEQTPSHALYDFNYIGRTWSFLNKVTDAYVYHPKIIDFIEDCKNLGWIDCGSWISLTGSADWNQSITGGIDQADLFKLKSILTFYINAGKFCDGFFVILLKKNYYLRF